VPADPEHPDVASLALDRVLHALSDPIRLDVVRQLAHRESVGCAELDYPVTKSTLSHHLRTLRLSGLTHTAVNGTQRTLTLRAADIESRFPGLLAAVGALPATMPPVTS
jgi:DNA-binding transcriptional ArsR family regulator